MAHDSYQLMISLSLDGLLNDDDQEVLYQHMRGCAMCAEMWSRMGSLDRLFSTQPEIAPPVNFALRVMERVQVYETRRRLRPWMLAVLALFSLMAGLSLTVPVVIVSMGVQTLAESWPAVGAVLVTLADGFDTLVSAATYVMDLLLGWLNFLASDPAALAVVITGLVLASTYIGLREGFKATRSESYEPQSA